LSAADAEQWLAQLQRRAAPPVFRLRIQREIRYILPRKIAGGALYPRTRLGIRGRVPGVPHGHSPRRDRLPDGRESDHHALRAQPWAVPRARALGDRYGLSSQSVAEVVAASATRAAGFVVGCFSRRAGQGEELCDAESACARLPPALASRHLRALRWRHRQSRSLLCRFLAEVSGHHAIRAAAIAALIATLGLVLAQTRGAVPCPPRALLKRYLAGTGAAGVTPARTWDGLCAAGGGKWVWAGKSRPLIGRQRRPNRPVFSRTLRRSWARHRGRPLPPGRLRRFRATLARRGAVFFRRSCNAKWAASRTTC